MLRVKRGGREAHEAFAELVARWQQPVISFVYRTLPDETEAEDLAQAVFVQVWKTAARYQPSAKFSTFLFTVARNLCLNELRRRSRHPADSLDEPRADDEQHPLRRGEHARVLDLERKQLIERVEIHELQAGGREDVRPRNDLFGSGEHAIRAGIAIADGIGEQGVIRTDEGEVDAPCVDADGRNRTAVPVRSQAKACNHLLPEPHEIPDELAVHRNRPVLEPMNLLQFEQPTVECP